MGLLYDRIAGPMTPFGRETPPPWVVSESDEEEEKEEEEDDDDDENEEGGSEGSLIPRLSDRQARQLRRFGLHAKQFVERMYKYGYPAFHLAYEGSFFVFQWMFLFSPQVLCSVQ
jgi:hypothetical protein